MSEQTVEFCFLPAIPAAYARMAREAAIKENAANASPFEAAADIRRCWATGRTLHIAFLEGRLEVQQKVAFYASEWCKHGNIRFLFDNSPEAEIRIAFQPGGSWSALGTEVLITPYFPKNRPTMNFGWLTPSTPDQEYSSVVLHEFGHALGLIHEHQTPAEGLQWNYEAVRKNLSGPPNYWDDATIQANIFAQYNEEQTQYSHFDPASIMNYPLPSTWTRNSLTVPRNSILSETDKQFIQKLYPW
jgi:hypothetical protein